MRPAESVITSAVNGHTAELAQIFEVSEARMYQLLSTHCHYQPAKLLIRAIAQVNQKGARLIQADLEALFNDILGEHQDTTLAERHKECSQALQADIEELPRAEQRKEWLDVMALAGRRIKEIDGENEHHLNGNGILPPEVRDAARKRRVK